MYEWNPQPNSSEGEGGIWQDGGALGIDDNRTFDEKISNGVVSRLDSSGFPVKGDCFIKLALDPATTNAVRSRMKTAGTWRSWSGAAGRFIRVRVSR